MTDALARYRTAGWLLFLALLLAGPDIFKPLHIDDGAYFYFARWSAAHPFDPYGFSLLWYQEPNEALSILAPPVVPYTWALGLRLFGDQPALCKLLLLPWALLLVVAVYALARRFGPALAGPLTIVAILSPALWPSTNFMLDMPALALALSALALFLRACDRNAFSLAAWAGLVAGIGFETKYTAVVALVVMVLAALLWRRWALGCLAVLVAIHTICAWEFLIAVLYGRSHFLLNLFGGHTAAERSLWDVIRSLIDTKGPLVTSLLSLLGGIAPALVLLSLLAQGVRRRWLLFTAALFLGCLVTIALFDSHLGGTIAPSARFFGPQQTPPLKFELADVLFGVFGGAVLVLAAIVAHFLFWGSAKGAWRDEVFLSGWLLLEIAAFFPLTPFPAVRRVLGIWIVLCLLIGRYAALRINSEPQRRALYAIVLFSVLLGRGLATVDFRSAAAQRDGVEQAAHWIDTHGGGRVWFTGHWGFQYYAEHKGWQAVIVDYQDPDGLLPVSRFASGDWLVIPDETIDQQLFQLDPEGVHEMKRLVLDDPVPFRTIPAFYGSPIAIQHLEGPRLQVRIYQVQKDFIPVPRPEPLVPIPYNRDKLP